MVTIVPVGAPVNASDVLSPSPPPASPSCVPRLAIDSASWKEKPIARDRVHRRLRARRRRAGSRNLGNLAGLVNCSMLEGPSTQPGPR
jgi:hypothetical protein